MGYGGFHPYPRRFGGGRPRLRIVHDALNAADGTAIDSSNPDTVAWIENMAAARVITFDGYGINERLSLQWDPDRMTAFLPRWEKILGIGASPTATEKDRRAQVKKRLRRFIEATAFHSRLLSRLQQELGDVFVAIEYLDIANANIHAPTGYPFGNPIDGFPWYSTVAHILVLVQKPTGYTEAEFYAAVGKVVPATDGLIPAWSTIDWYRAPTGYPAVSVSGGPSRSGFYLDAEANLDNNVFGSYSPLDEAGCTGWFDPRDYDAGVRGSYLDKSGTGNHFEQTSISSPDNRPYIVDGAINGQRGLLIDGSASAATYLLSVAGKTLASFLAAAAGTMLFVYRVKSVACTEAPYVLPTPMFNDSNNRVSLGFRAGNSTLVAYNDDDGVVDVNDQVGTPTIHDEVHYATWRHSGGVLYVSVDGGPESSTPSGDTSDLTGTLALGPGNNTLVCYYGTQLLYNVSLSAAALTRLGAYLRSEWFL